MGAFGTIASTIAGLYAWEDEVDAIEAQNEARLQAWNVAASALRDQLSTGYNRTGDIEVQIRRDNIVQQIAIRGAAHRAKGQATVKAAQMGIQGRGQADITRDISIEEANAVSEVMINTEIQMINTVNQFNDAARSAVDNLNAQSPTPMATPSVMTGLINTVGSGLNYYNNLSTTQQKDVQNVFSFKQFDFGTKTKVDSAQIDTL
jgi:hypothetical protein